MTNKITMQMLAEKLAASAGVSRETAETFLRTFPDALLASVAQDRLVELDNFGKFYLVAVSDRGSVDVNTGAHIVIPGYDKLTFAVDDTIVDQFNGVQPKAENNATENSAEISVENSAEGSVETANATTGAVVTSEAASTETPIATPSTKKAKAPISAAQSTPKKTQKKVKGEAQKTEPAVKPAEPAAEPVAKPAAESVAESVVKPPVEPAAKTTVEQTIEQAVEQLVQPADHVSTSEQTISLAAEETKVIVDQPKAKPSANAKVEPSVNIKVESSVGEPKHEPAAGQNTVAKAQSESPAVNETAEGFVARFFKNLPWWGYVTLVAIIFLILLFIVLNVGGNKDGDEAEESTDSEAMEQVEGQPSTETKAKETAEKKSPKVHILKYGESLTTISVQYYGTEDSMGVIWRLNGFKDPNNIPLGTAIKLP